MKNRWILLSLTGLFLLFPTAAQNGVPTSEELMRRGLEHFKQGRFELALYDFREITLESSLSEYNGSAYFWIAKSYLAMGNWDLAEENLLFFLEDFEGHPFYEEGLYQKGRILFLKEKFQESIAVFYDFIERYPSSDYLANALFWVGECLFSLGHYAEAQGIYHRVVTEYPGSYKVETAEYRLSLIDIYNREEVLLNLLKLSHEEYLGSLEDFQRRERTYEQALGVYQRRIVELTKALEARGIPGSSAPAMTESPEKSGDVISGTSEALKLLEMKNLVLEIKEFYIDLMEKQYGEGM